MKIFKFDYNWKSFVPNICSSIYETTMTNQGSMFLGNNGSMLSDITR